ncbi:MAG: SocA family protein [Acidobacteria bacterium]|nr:SocA family protein [Acidobacteriota bacterium]
MRFNETKATQAAAHLIKRRGQGFMSYMKLIKLLYFADREALIRWGSPITTDSYYSMDRGPVLSRVHDLVTEGASPVEPHFWEEHIQPHGDHEVRMVADPSNSELSEIEEELLDEVFDKYGRLSRWQIVDEAHKLPEWEDPHGGRICISYRNILHFGQKSSEQIEAILRDLHASEHVHKVLAAS